MASGFSNKATRLEDSLIVDLQILLHSKQIVAQLQPTDALLGRLCQENLLTSVQVQHIKRKTHEERSSQLLQELFNVDFSMQSFIQCLRTSQSELADQLEGCSQQWYRLPPASLPVVDLRALKDADRVVFKTFGSSRRLAERDKKRISEVIALRSQLMQQDLAAEEAQLRRSVREQRQRRDRLEQRLSQVNAQVNEIVKHHRLDRIVHFVDMRSTSDVLRMGASLQRRKDDLDQLEDGVNLLLSRFTRLLIECRSMRRRLETIDSKPSEITTQTL